MIAAVTPSSAVRVRGPPSQADRSTGGPATIATRLRGLADRVLVLTPAGLVEQWREELERKFALPTAILTAGAAGSAAERPVQLASIAAARRDPLRGKLTGPAQIVVSHPLPAGDPAKGQL